MWINLAAIAFDQIPIYLSFVFHNGRGIAEPFMVIGYTFLMAEVFMISTINIMALYKFYKIV